MRPTLWKKLLSYVHEFEIESTQSEVNESLHVTLRNGRYVLNTPNAVYSYEDLYSNFFKAFQHIAIEKQEIKTVLVLGLGLGSIPFMLEKRFACEFDYTAVEIDEDVIYLADKYALSDLKSYVEVVCTDACIFVEVCEDKYDLICIDVFVDDKIPEDFLYPEFLESCKELLTDKGLIMFNHLALTAKDIQLAEDYYKTVFKSVFPEGRYLDTTGNWILMNK